MDMSLATSAPDGDDGPFWLCNSHSWSEFTALADGLDDTYPRVKELVETGSTKDTLALGLELSELEHTVAVDMANLLGIGDPEETITVGSE